MSGDEPDTTGPGGPVICYGGLSNLVAGFFLPEIFNAKSGKDAAQILVVEFGIVASNYVLNKMSDRYWHWRYPEDNPRGKIFKDATQVQAIIAGGAFAFRAGCMALEHLTR